MYLEVDGENWTPPASYETDIGIMTRESFDSPWSRPVSLGATINSNRYDTSPWISTDGLTLYFSSSRPGGNGSYDIYTSTRASQQAPWQPPINLGPTVNSSLEDFSQCICSDGLSLYFVSMRLGGYGGTDIYVTTRQTTDSPWTQPVNLGLVINDQYHNSGPSISSDGTTLIFCSLPDWDSDNELYLSRLSADGQWSTPVGLGEPINTAASELFPCLTLDGRTLYFTRYNENIYPEIFESSITPVVDFNDDGVVSLDDLVILIEHWGTDEPLCDIGPTPFGDDTVDINDLEVFMQFYEQENTETP
jgi:Tol biopolymer transport system component